MLYWAFCAASSDVRLLAKPLSLPEIVSLNTSVQKVQAKSANCVAATFTRNFFARRVGRYGRMVAKDRISTKGRGSALDVCSLDEDRFWHQRLSKWPYLFPPTWCGFIITLMYWCAGLHCMQLWPQGDRCTACDGGHGSRCSRQPQRLPPPRTAGTARGSGKKRAGANSAALLGSSFKTFCRWKKKTNKQKASVLTRATRIFFF